MKTAENKGRAGLRRGRLYVGLYTGGGNKGLRGSGRLRCADRTAEGYGINERIVDAALSDGIDTILTCDNGIAASQVVSYAKEKGLRVIITDHHEVQYIKENGETKYIIPEADAVVDPKRPDCPYPFKQLCGAGIAYKAAEVLYGFSAGEGTSLERLLRTPLSPRYVYCGFDRRKPYHCKGRLSGAGGYG